MRGGFGEGRNAVVLENSMYEDSSLTRGSEQPTDDDAGQEGYYDEPAFQGGVGEDNTNPLYYESAEDLAGFACGDEEGCHCNVDPGKQACRLSLVRRIHPLSRGEGSRRGGGCFHSSSHFQGCTPRTSASRGLGSDPNTDSPSAVPDQTCQTCDRLGSGELLRPQDSYVGWCHHCPAVGWEERTVRRVAAVIPGSRG